jgi:hypothetical protein
MGESLENIASKLANADTPPDTVFLYGDHAPPFTEARLKQYFDAHNVPIVRFALKETGAHPERIVRLVSTPSP